MDNLLIILFLTGQSMFWRITFWFEPSVLFKYNLLFIYLLQKLFLKGFLNITLGPSVNYQETFKHYLSNLCMFNGLLISLTKFGFHIWGN